MIVPIQGTERTPSQLPIKLWHFGVNPYRKPLYRLVWGPSRYYMVGGGFEDRGERTAPTNTELFVEGKDTTLEKKVSEYRWIQKYPAPRWVLEKWLSAFAFGGSRQTWELTMKDEESGLYVLGPYPEKGEYEECYIFPPGEPGASKVEEIVQMIEAGKRYSFQERKDAHLRELHKQKKASVDRAVGVWEESQGAFNNQASNVHPGKRTPDHVKLDLVLPDTGADEQRPKFSMKFPNERGA